jgi:hypothetical protein
MIGELKEKNMDTEERIERAAEKYCYDHQYVFAKRYFTDGAKYERNKALQEAIDEIRNYERILESDQSQLISRLESLKLKS